MTKATNADRARRMVEYRKEKKAEMAKLYVTLAELNKKATELEFKSTGGDAMTLSWKEIADVMKEESNTSQAYRDYLLARVAKQKKILQELRSWVIANSTLQIILDPMTSTWRHTSLLSDSTSRRLGKQWIMEQMYHNAERMFMRHQFPAINSNDTIDYDWEISGSGASWRGVYRRQSELFMSIDEYLTVYDKTFGEVHCDLLPGAWAGKTEIHTDKHDNISQYTFLTPRNELVNIILGRFRPSADKCILVMQYVDSDETVSGYYRQRFRKRWYELHRLSDGRVICRMLAVGGLSYYPNGHYDLDEDAHDYGIDLSDCPEELREIRFSTCAGYRIKMLVQHARSFQPNHFKATQTLDSSDCTI